MATEAEVPAVRVVVADDDPAIRHLVSAWFARIPTVDVVAAVDDAMSAVEAVRLHRPGVVILDVHMPGVSGLDVLDEIRAIDAALPIIVWSSDPGSRARALDLGVGRWVDKGSGLDRLHAAIAEIGAREPQP